MDLNPRGRNKHFNFMRTLFGSLIQNVSRRNVKAQGRLEQTVDSPAKGKVAELSGESRNPKVWFKIFRRGRADGAKRGKASGPTSMGTRGKRFPRTPFGNLSLSISVVFIYQSKNVWISISLSVY